MAAESMCSTPASALEKPRNSWERMTPELPRAPLSAPRATAWATTEALALSTPMSSFTAETIVSDILVPVSPSGTGNTLRASMLCLFFSSRAGARQDHVLEQASVNVG